MHESELLSPYATKAVEYGLSILYLALFVPFWRYLNGPARVRVPSTAWRFADWFHVPDGVHLHAGHTWARPEAGGVAVGIDAFGHGLVGSLDGVQLPTVGLRVRQGDPAFEIRTGGRSFPLRAPVSGTVVAVNEAAATAPDGLHRDPYGAGWLFRVEPTGLAKSLKKLVTGERARLFLAEAAERLQQAFHPGAPVLAQDGGTPVHGIARDLDPEHWEDLVRASFQVR
jgi:glycine cleavage system H lipoate-binding protein